MKKPYFALALSTLILSSLFFYSCGSSGGGVGGTGGNGGTDTTAPTVPANITLTVASEIQINLSWTASSDNIGVVGYNVYRDNLFLKTASTISTSDTGLTAWTSYCYKVSAHDTAGNESNLSTQTCATTLDTTEPSQPTGMTVSAVSGSQINISWAAPSDNVGITGYKIYRDGAYLKTVTTTSTSDAGLTDGTSYCYRVSAVDASSNESVLSAQVCAVTLDTTDPSVPTTVIAIAVLWNRIDLLWTAATDNVGVTAYKVYRDGTYLKTVNTITTLNTGLSASTSYCYTVSAIDAVSHESAQSTQACAATPAFVYHLPDTGQVISYTTTTGEDADYIFYPPSYTDNADGTVTDNMTGLIWQQQVDNTSRLLVDAFTYCADLTTAGISWRLPTAFELRTIVDYGRQMPAIDDTYFFNTSSDYYCDTTPLVGYPNQVWAINFGSGGWASPGSGYVRCVFGVQEVSTFTVDTDTATDSLTKLIWQRQDDNTLRTWEQALSYCEDLSLGGYSDWRLPNIKELASIVDFSKSAPPINSTVFLSTSITDGYWSSTTSSTNAWHISFDRGDAGRTPTTYLGRYVRCVRGGQ